jgi:hypothetical protein
MCEPNLCQNCNLASGLCVFMEYTDRLRVREELGVNLIHSCEIVHVGKKDVNLDRLGEA